MPQSVEVETATYILLGLGGSRFSAMTGAKNFAAVSEQRGGLSFRIPRTNSINYVKIVLNGLDLYNVEFGRIHGAKYTVVKSVENVYNDMLVELFERTTGLYTSFRRVR